MDEFKKQADNWILVLDKVLDPHSSKQVDVCSKNNIGLKGAIFCNETEHKNTQACLQVPSFPSFCNMNKKVCVSGLRTEEKHFQQLLNIIKNS